MGMGKGSLVAEGKDLSWVIWWLLKLGGLGVIGIVQLNFMAIPTSLFI